MQLNNSKKGSQEILWKNMKESGLSEYGVTPANGDCFFEAICLQLQRLATRNYQNINAAKLRKNVVNLLQNTTELKVRNKNTQ